VELYLHSPNTLSWSCPLVVVVVVAAAAVAVMLSPSATYVIRISLRDIYIYIYIYIYLNSDVASYNVNEMKKSHVKRIFKYEPYKYA
jgi:hypothetical protein